MSVERYFKIKGANTSADSKVITIPSGTTVLINAIDFTAPAQQSAGIKIYAGPVGSSNTMITAAQGDKFMQIPSVDGQVEGPMDIRIELDNSNNASVALLGAAIYYEKL